MCAMPQHAAPTPPDRSPEETQLRLMLREGARCAGTEAVIGPEARAALDALLADRTRDRAAFEWELEQIYALHGDFADAWDCWREEHAGGLRGPAGPAAGDAPGRPATGEAPVSGEAPVPGDASAPAGGPAPDSAPPPGGTPPPGSAPGHVGTPVPGSAPDPESGPAAQGAPLTVDGAPDADPGGRVLNLALCWPLSRRTVPRATALRAGSPYELRLDIGDPAADSLLGGYAPPFPDDLLPHEDDGGRGDWLDVVVLSDDFTVAADHHAYFLPLSGSGWVCPCPAGTAHVCGPQHRTGSLRVAVTAPRQTGPARLRVIVAHRGNQLQSASVTAWVAPREEPGPAASAVVDFTLTAGFSALDALPARTAGIRIGHGDHGALTVDVLGAGAPVGTFRLNELLVRDALDRTRDALDHVHAEPVAGGPARNRLLPGNRKEAGEALHDLLRLAGVGWDLFNLLAPHAEQRSRLAETLGDPAEIQVCRENSRDIMFPWAFVYDIPIDADDAPRFCTAGLRAMTADPDARACPDAAGHGYNTLCPYGFWGFRHFIEQPPSLPPGRGLALFAGRGGGAPHMTVARSRALDEALSGRHLAALRETFGDEITDCADRAALRAALAAGQQDCVYFYCHGRRPDGSGEPAATTVLEIGHDERIRPSSLTAWGTGRADWKRSTPLVFLNGCHTVDAEPGSWLGFVDAFSGLYASGTVGTEISVEQSLATEVAETFWQHFVAGESVGRALHRVRTGLLRKGNVLGLAYTAYCSNSLRLRRDER